jgi:L-aminopeptidase/D-esterase-like protein
MGGAITDVTGIRVGHAENGEALTGCTVVLCSDGAVVGVDVRGPAPATRETDLCRPGTLVEVAHAVLLTGGSAFGLDAASGIMRYLYERRIGFPTGVVPVPIVPGAAIFDLGVGAVAWPDGEMGYRACASAGDGPVATGNVGAGIGATVGKRRGPQNAMKSGIGTASVRAGEAAVGALMVVNAVGNVIRPDGRIVAGARDESGGFANATGVTGGAAAAPPWTNTTIGVIATDATLTPDQANHLASIAHDGLARAIRPAHTLFDGDAIFALATGKGAEMPLGGIQALAEAAAAATEMAVLDAVLSAEPAGGLPAASG